MTDEHVVWWWWWSGEFILSLVSYCAFVSGLS